MSMLHLLNFSITMFSIYNIVLFRKILMIVKINLNLLMAIYFITDLMLNL